MSLESSFLDIKEKIYKASTRVRRDPNSVTLLGVSKTQSAQAITEYFEICKKQSFPCQIGESYLQELISKKEFVSKDIKIHFIGGIQNSKLKKIVLFSDVIQSVASAKTIKKLSHILEASSLKKDIFLQVNISQDLAKLGFAPEELEEYLEICLKDKFITVRGLMTILKDYDTVEETRRDYRLLRSLRDYLAEKLSTPLLLSMGMSSDFEIAIEEGSDMVRVGSLLFGERSKTPLT
jgi:PLP dependent protein